ncbi:hypothetical protein UlMin_017833 [Ulmus minor]
MSSRLFGKKKEKETSEERFFLKNGAAVLEQLISSLNGDCNPIRNYSAHQLKTATNSYHHELMLQEEAYYKLYKGNHEDREIAVKIFIYKRRLENIANEAAIASRMSSHNNVLKLLGCCLETEWPILVYEYPKMGNLLDCLNRTDLDVPLTLELRLRIAMKVANAVAYLHHGLSKKFIHRDINPRTIFLDQNFEPKLFDFQWALSIPEGENHVQVDSLMGILGFIAPEGFSNFRYSEKSDVFAFGSLFSEILTKKRISNIVQDKILAGKPFERASAVKKFVEAILLHEENRAQVMEATKLIEACHKFDPDDRPDMIEVAKALRLIINS